MPLSVRNRQEQYVNRRSFLAANAASLVAAALSSDPLAFTQGLPGRQREDDLDTTGIRMIPVVNGKYKVWTKKLGSGSIKILLLHGGPGVGHEYLEVMESFLPQAGIEMQYYSQLGYQPDDPTLWTLPRYVEEVDEVRRGLGLDRFVLYGHSWGASLPSSMR